MYKGNDGNSDLYTLSHKLNIKIKTKQFLKYILNEQYEMIHYIVMKQTVNIFISCINKQLGQNQRYEGQCYNSVF